MFQGSQAQNGEIPLLRPLPWWRVPRAAELWGRAESDLWALSVQPASDLRQAGGEEDEEEGGDEIGTRGS